LRFPTRRIPIYIGAMGPAMLRASGRGADGALPLLFPPEHFSTAIGYFRDGLVGTAADLIPRLEGLVSMGARHLSFGPPLGPDPLAAIHLLGREVLPRFRV